MSKPNRTGGWLTIIAIFLTPILLIFFLGSLMAYSQVSSRFETYQTIPEVTRLADLSALPREQVVMLLLPFRLKTHDNPAGTDQAAFDKSAQAMKADRARFCTGFFRTFFGVATGASPVSQELLDWARGIAMQASLKATPECARSFSSTDFRGELPAFKVPTLIIHGTEDKTVPIDASSRAAAKGIAGRTLIEYEGAPHGLFATHKARLTKDLLDFTGR